MSTRTKESAFLRTVRYHLIEHLIELLNGLKPARMYDPAELQEALRHIPYFGFWASQFRMPRVLRWKRYRKLFKALPHQDLGQHYASIMLVAIEEVDRVRRATSREFDSALVLKATAYHEYGEVILGEDVDATGKTHDHDVEEVHAVLEALADVPEPRRTEILEYFLLQFVRLDSYEHFGEAARSVLESMRHLRFESVLFRMIEIKDYLMTAIECRLGDGHGEIICNEVLPGNMGEIQTYISEFPELGVLWTQEFLEYVTRLSAWDGTIKPFGR